MTVQKSMIVINAQCTLIELSSSLVGSNLSYYQRVYLLIGERLRQFYIILIMMMTMMINIVNRVITALIGLVTFIFTHTYF